MGCAPIKCFHNRFIVLLIAQLTGFLIGYDSILIYEVSGEVAKDFSLSLVALDSIVPFVILVIAISTALSGSRRLEIFGRKTSILVGVLLFVLGSLISAVSTNFIVHMIGRFFMSVSQGILFGIAPLYIHEQAPPHLQGASVSGFNMMIINGLIIGAIIGGLLLGNENGWRWVLAISGALGFLEFILMYQLPESAMFLMTKGLEEDALVALTELRGPEMSTSAIRREASTKFKAALPASMAPPIVTNELVDQILADEAEHEENSGTMSAVMSRDTHHSHASSVKEHVLSDGRGEFIHHSVAQALVDEDIVPSIFASMILPHHVVEQDEHQSLDGLGGDGSDGSQIDGSRGGGGETGPLVSGGSGRTGGSATDVERGAKYGAIADDDGELGDDDEDESSKSFAYDTQPYFHVPDRAMSYIGEHVPMTSKRRDLAETQEMGLWERVRASPSLALELECGVVLFVINQWTGIHPVMYFATDILYAAGFTDPTLARYAVAPLQLVHLVGVLLCQRGVDHIGRKVCALWSTGGMFVSLALITYGLHYGAHMLSFAGLLAYLFTFGIGMSSVPNVIAAEIFPPDIRPLCLGLVSSVFWISNLCVSASFEPIALLLSPAVAFLFYTVVAAIGFVWIWFRLPMTVGVPVDKMKEVFKADPAGLTQFEVIQAEG